jgi:hypothetical protein
MIEHSNFYDILRSHYLTIYHYYTTWTEYICLYLLSGFLSLSCCLSLCILCLMKFSQSSSLNSYHERTITPSSSLKLPLLWSKVTCSRQMLCSLGSQGQVTEPTPQIYIALSLLSSALGLFPRPLSQINLFASRIDLCSPLYTR